MTAPIVYDVSRTVRHILAESEVTWIFSHSNGDERRLWDKHRAGQLWERIAEASR